MACASRQAHGPNWPEAGNERWLELSAAFGAMFDCFGYCQPPQILLANDVSERDGHLSERMRRLDVVMNLGLSEQERDEHTGNLRNYRQRDSPSQRPTRDDSSEYCRYGEGDLKARVHATRVAMELGLATMFGKRVPQKRVVVTAE